MTQNLRKRLNVEQLFRKRFNLKFRISVPFSNLPLKILKITQCVTLVVGFTF